MAPSYYLNQIRSLETEFTEILIEMYTYSLERIHLKMSSAKWRPFCLGLNVLVMPVYCNQISTTKGEIAAIDGILSPNGFFWINILIHWHTLTDLRMNVFVKKITYVLDKGLMFIRLLPIE